MTRITEENIARAYKKYKAANNTKQNTVNDAVWEAVVLALQNILQESTGNNTKPLPEPTNINIQTTTVRDVYTIKQLASYLSCSTALIYKLTRYGKLKLTKIGRKTIFLKTDVEEYLRNLRT